MLLRIFEVSSLDLVMSFGLCFNSDTGFTAWTIYSGQFMLIIVFVIATC